MSSEREYENLVWIDIETTGTDPDEDAILEVAIVATTKTVSLDIVAEDSWVIRPSRNIPITRINPYVWNMHRGNGLWKESIESKNTIKSIECNLVRFINDNKAVGSILCGGNVGFDRSFMRTQLIDVIGLLHYRNLDVSSIRNMAALHLKNIHKGAHASIEAELEPASDGKHRALHDIHKSISEYRYYIGSLNKA